MKEFSARYQLVIAHFLKKPARLSSDLKDCQLGSARKNPARLGSAQLAKFQLGCTTSGYVLTYIGAPKRDLSRLAISSNGFKTLFKNDS